MSKTKRIVPAWIFIASSALAQTPASTPTLPPAPSDLEGDSNVAPGNVDEPPQQLAEASLLAGSEFASLLADQVPSSYDRLLATIVVEDKAAQVSWAPFLGGANYYEWLSETRLQVGQKDGKTNLGLVLRWNPLSPRSRRGVQAWRQMKVPFFGDEYAQLREVRQEQLRQMDTILAEESPSITTLRLKVEELIRESQDLDLTEEQKKVVNEQLEATTKQLATVREGARIIRRTRILEQIVTLQRDLDQTTDPSSRAAIIAEIDTKLNEVSLEDPELAAVEARIAAIEKANAKKGSATVAAYEQELFTQPLPVLSLSYVATLFPGIGGSFVDVDADGLDDNAHTLAARSILLSGLLRMGPKNQLSMAVGRSWKRTAAEEGAGLGEADNYALTYARRLKVLDPKYEQSEDYLSSLFVPSIVGGLSAELSDCRSQLPDCQDKAERILAITPFVDLKLKKSIQFRLGVSWKQFSGSAVADEQLGVVSLIGLQLGLPN